MAPHICHTVQRLTLMHSTAHMPLFSEILFSLTKCPPSSADPFGYFLAPLRFTMPIVRHELWFILQHTNPSSGSVYIRRTYLSKTVQLPFLNQDTNNLRSYSYKVQMDLCRIDSELLCFFDIDFKYWLVCKVGLWVSAVGESHIRANWIHAIINGFELCSIYDL